MKTMMKRPFSSPMTWAAETLLENDGLVGLDGECIAELDQAATEITDNPLPVEALEPSNFEMPACQTAMARVRDQIDNGIGFAIIDRIPVEGLETDTAKKLYWLLMSMTGRPVAQKWDGTMVYDVIDTGR